MGPPHSSLYGGEPSGGGSILICPTFYDKEEDGLCGEEDLLEEETSSSQASQSQGRSILVLRVRLILIYILSHWLAVSPHWTSTGRRTLWRRHHPYPKCPYLEEETSSPQASSFRGGNILLLTVLISKRKHSHPECPHLKEGTFSSHAFSV